MELRPKTIDHDTLRRLLDTGSPVRADVVGRAGGWGVVINHGRAHQILTVRRGHARLFRRFETLAAYLRDMGITAFHVDATEFDTGAAVDDPSDRRRATASERMKHAHEAAGYDNWFRQSVQAAIDDPRPSVPDEEVRREYGVRRDALRLRGKATPR